MSDVGLLLILVAVIAIVAVTARRSAGRSRATATTFSAGELAAIGAGGGGSKLLLFTAPGCAPCTAARSVLDAAAQRHGAAVVSIDVTEHEGLARQKQIWRAPTSFVIDGSGRAVTRISGVPRPDTLDEALTGQATPA